MKIYHIIHNEWTREQVKVLKPFGIKVEQGYGRFDIEDGIPYKQIESYLLKWNVEETISTVYNDKDIEESKLLVYVATWPRGYPQPENVIDYIELTYSTKNFCKDCGVGIIQKEPFRIKSEPKWGEKKIFELNWVFDEIFVRKDIYESVFKKLDIDCWPVLLYKRETVIENTVQLRLPFIEKNNLLLKDQPFVLCKTCDRKKYSPKIRGYFPGFEKEVLPSLQVFKSHEYFGADFEAHNKIFITPKIFKELNLLKIKPNVWPVR